MLVSDNQQVTDFGTSETTCELSDNDLNWLARIYEAQGIFSLKLDYRNKAEFRIELMLKDSGVIDKAVEVLNKYKISHYIFVPQNKKITYIRTIGFLRCERFLVTMKNRWIIRDYIKKTELMKEFIDSRCQMLPRDPYTVRQLQIIQTMSDLNRKKI